MPKHAISEHLLPGEVKLIEKLLGDSCCRAMGIAELAISPIQSTVLTEQIHKFKWNSIIKPGVVCFNTDPQRNNDYYIKVFSMNKGKKIWEQRIDLNMKFNRRRRHLITFDGNLCGRGTICLNFIDNDEADDFAWEMSKVMKPQRQGNPNKENSVFSQKWVRNNIGEEEFEKLKVFLRVACMEVSVLDDREKGPEVFQFYKDQIHEKEEIDIAKQDVYGTIDPLELNEYDYTSSDDYDSDLPDPETPEADITGGEYYDIDSNDEPLEDTGSADITGGEYYDIDIDDETIEDSISNPNVGHKIGVLPKDCDTTTKSPPTKPEKTSSIAQKKKIQDQQQILSPSKKGSIKFKGGQPPTAPLPPPPPALGPLPPPPSIEKKKPKTKVNTNRDTTAHGAGNQDLLGQIKAGMVLKTTASRSVKDVKPKPSNTLSDILGGALAKIKDANDIYGRNDDPYSEWD